MTHPTIGFDDFEQHIQVLLKRGGNGAYLILQPKGETEAPFVQFRKLIHGPGDYEIEISFPLAKWSEAYFEQVWSLSEREILPGHISDDGGMTFLHIPFGKDSKEAARFATLIFHEVFGLEEVLSFERELHHVSAFDELIDSPKKEQSVFSRTLRQTITKLERTYNIKLATIVLGIFGFFSLILCYMFYIYWRFLINDEVFLTFRWSGIEFLVPMYGSTIVVWLLFSWLLLMFFRFGLSKMVHTEQQVRVSPRKNKKLAVLLLTTAFIVLDIFLFWPD